jgi:hypothetical protein
MDDLGKDEAKRRGCEDKASYKSSCFALRCSVFVRSVGPLFGSSLAKQSR